MKKFTCYVLMVVFITAIIPLGVQASSGIRVHDNEDYERQWQKFESFIEQMTLDIVGDKTTDSDKLKAIYDFMVLNFEYSRGRDGAVIDGSQRPNPEQVPQLSSMLVRIVKADRGIMGYGFTTKQLADVLFTRGYSEDYTISVGHAYVMLLTGYGTCDSFAGLFQLMAHSIGFNVEMVEGYYNNSSGGRSSHRWNAVTLNGIRYFFDPQIEASNSTRNRLTTPAYLWFMQDTDNERTQQRYTEELW